MPILNSVSAVVVGLVMLAASGVPLTTSAHAQGGGDPPPCRTATAYPDAINLVAPDPALPPELSAFAGVWEGVNSDGVPTRLIVERIDSGSAVGKRTNGDGPNNIRAFVLSFTAQVQPGGRLVWNGGDAGSFTYVMGSDLNSVQGTFTRRGFSNTVTMTRCTWQ